MLQQVLNSDPVLASVFARDPLFNGWSAYPGGTLAVAVFYDEDATPRVEVYTEDGETPFSQDLTGLPVRVAAAWVREALDFRSE